MKKNVAVIVLGVLFGVSLGVVSYLYLVLGIAFGLTGMDFMVNMWILFAGLAVICIIFSCFAKKVIALPRVGLTVAVVISAILHVFSLIQFISLDAIESTNIALFVVLFGSLALGLAAMILAYKCKVPKTNETTQQ